MVLLCCQPAAASESVEFAAPVYAEGSVRAFMRNETAGEVRIAGTLFLPKKAPAPMPTMLLPDGTVRDNMTREEIAGNFKGCLTTGGSIGYRRAATDKALADTAAFLKKSFAAVQ